MRASVRVRARVRVRVRVRVRARDRVRARGRLRVRARVRAERMTTPPDMPRGGGSGSGVRGAARRGELMLMPLLSPE